MSHDIVTRMGDGERVSLSAEEVHEDIQAGTADAADRGGIPELTAEEQERLFDIIADPSRIVSVKPGEEVIVTDDGCTMSFYSGQDGGGVGVPLSRLQAVLTYERACGADTTSLGHSDYSYKPVKPIINFEANDYYNTSMLTTAPFFYGAQPNLGLYFQPDGPCPNAAELMPMGKIDEARQAQEEAAGHLAKDLVFVGSRLAEVGLEGLNFDTSGSAGDADFMAALKGVAELKRKVPDLPILMGASGEFILGMHGRHRRRGHQHRHDGIAAVQPGPGGHLCQSRVRSLQHPRPCQRGYGRVRYSHDGAAAHRFGDTGVQGPGADRQSGRIVDWRRRSHGDAYRPYHGLVHGGHPHRRRSGGLDADDPKDENSRSQGICGGKTGCGRHRPDR